jgi:squalene-associated FAD-dependent desaturase
MMQTRRVAVIGAGWSGLAAAVTLSQADVPVTLFESAREPGGRARALDWNEDGMTQRIDNGQHILIGAYRATLELMQQVKNVAEEGLQRLPLTLADTQGLSLRAARLPAPLHLLFALSFARGLSLASRIAMVRLIESAKAIGWRLEQDTSVSAWLRTQRQPEELVRRIWLPLCVAALNTPPTIASAQIFLNVLRDSLGAERSASDLLLPMTSLDAALPYPAVEYLKRHGASIRLGTPVLAVDEEGERCRIETRAGAEHFDAVVAAVPAHQVSNLFSRLSGVSWERLREQCDAFTWQPIATCYLVFDGPIALATPMMALAENLQTGRFGQWVFARGQLGGRADTLAVVISANGPHLDLPQRELAIALHQQLREELKLKANLLGSRVITEKRATFAAVPGLRRPTGATPSPRLVLAGDYVDCDYPATLESAVMSGRAAAHLILPILSAFSPDP